MDNIFIIVLGLFMLYLSYGLIVKHDLSTVHKYHRNFVMEQHEPAFCRGLGIGEAIMGLGILSIPILQLITGIDLDIVGLILILGGLAYIIYTIIKYNGRLF